MKICGVKRNEQCVVGGVWSQVSGSSWDRDKKGTEVKEDESGWCYCPLVSGHDKMQTIGGKVSDDA